MRRLFWCSAVPLVTAAAVFYLATEYVQRHPDSVLARCAFFGCRWAQKCNPLSPLDRALAGWSAGSRKSAVPNVPARPEEIPAPVPEFAEQPALEPLQPGELSAREQQEVAELFRQHGSFFKPEAEEQSCRQPERFCPGAELCRQLWAQEPSLPRLVSDDALADAVENGGVEECESKACGQECPKVMPPASDDDDAPVTMPYTDDTSPCAENRLFHFWMGLFEAPEDAASEETPKKNQPENPQRGGADEESETMDLGQPSNCREDPAIDHQYPGCPYTGMYQPNRCPAPVIKPEMTPKPKTEWSAPGMFLNVKPAHWRSLLPKHDGASSEESPVHPEVDTMEFRPSQDAHKGEFDQKPM